MKTIGELLRLSSSFLKGNRKDAEAMICHVLKMKKIELYLQFDKPVIESEIEILRTLLKRCAKNEPVEYIIGEIDFFGAHFKIDPRALIPRPETEILVDIVSKRAKKGVFLDLCTGAGYVGIALKKANPELTVVLSDISADALALAAENAQLNKVEVEILQGDLLEPFKGRRADFIFCNPPYISEKEYLTLDPSVRLFEPKLALVGGEKGTEFYERLQKDLPPDAKCFFEIGSTQGDRVKQIFQGKGEVLSDWAGHPRFFIL